MSLCQSVATVVGLFLVSAAWPAETLFDPSLDHPDQEWCYAAQSTTVIGLPFVPEPVQVTYDGAIYTRHAELAFFYGQSLRPVMARNKTFREGWIPIVGYAWKDEGIDYGVEVFSAEVPPLGRSNLVQFARLTMTNPGNSAIEGVVAAAVRGTGGPFRLGEPRRPVVPNTRFRLDPESLWRDDDLIYSFSSGAERYAVANAPYQGEFQAQEHGVTNQTGVGLAVYRRELKPGETFAATFKLPRVPVRSAEHVAAVTAADYTAKREETLRYWKALLGDMEFVIPEKRVNDSYRAALVHLILATRDNGGKRQGSGLAYDDLFLNDYMDMQLAYLTAGLPELSAPNAEWLIQKQHPSGMFIDVHNRGNADIVTSHGQGLFSLAYPIVMNRDLVYGRKVYPAIQRGAQFIVNDHLTNNAYGLIRASIPYDAPMLTGHHTCHNLFALLALRTSIRAARLLGQTDDADRWTAAEATYRAAILRAVDDIDRREGYIRSGLYDWTPGRVQGNGPVNDFPNQDWENNLLVYPTELLGMDDPRVARTLATIRERKYREGVMTYRNGMHIHQYVTLNQAQQYRAIGDQRHALLDLYHVLLHNGSTHEGFENLVVPWANRTPEAGCPPPHAWAAAKTALFIRNMMVCEYGGQGGLAEEARDLYLFSLVSPAWIRPGNSVSIRNAPSEMGRITSRLTFTADGAELEVRPQFHHRPRHIVLRIPYSVELETFTSDASESARQDHRLCFSPDVTRASLRWRLRSGVHDQNFQDILQAYRREFGFVVRDGNYAADRAGKPFLTETDQAHPPEPLSFDLVRRAFLTEYGRRFTNFLASGGKPYPVEPPALLPPWRSTTAKSAAVVRDPDAKLARPSAPQYAWHEQERIQFVCFDPCTWQGREYDNHSTPLTAIDPAQLDTDQWCRAAQSWGAKGILFVAKHTGGFCWWRTDTTSYGVKETAWKGGKGDLLAELSASCRRHGLSLGIYVYPGDDTWEAPIGSGGRTKDPGKQEAYNRVFRQQLTEVLTRYGKISEVWFDGSCVIDVSDLLREHAADAVIFQGPQATIRWPGTESGRLPYPAWNSLRSEDLRTGVATAAQGNPDGDAWAPLEADTTLYNHNWFWAAANEAKRKSLSELMDIYYKSVGRGGVLLLNSSPNTNGLIPVGDLKLYAAFGQEIERRFGRPIAELNNAQGAAVELALPRSTMVNHVVIMEDYREGERIREYAVEARTEGEWREVARGSSVGRKKIDVFRPLQTDRLRLRIIKSAAPPRIRHLATFYVPDVSAGSLTTGRPTTASAVHSAPYEAAMATDHNPETRWGCPDGTTVAWLEVDLGASTAFGRVQLSELADRIRAFSLLYRDTPEADWKVALTGGRVGDRFQQDFATVTGRFVRLDIREATGPPTIWEFNLEPGVQTWQRCGEWTAKAFRGTSARLEFDLSPFITQPGQFEVKLEPTGGPGTFRIVDAILLYEGEAATPGLLTRLAETNTFNVNRTAQVTQETSSVLRVGLEAEQGPDCAGTVWIRPRPSR